MSMITDDVQRDARPEPLAIAAVHSAPEVVADARDEFVVEWQLEVAATR